MTIQETKSNRTRYYEYLKYEENRRDHIYSLVNEYRELQLKSINDELNHTWYFSTEDKKRMKDIIDTLHSIGFGREI